MMLQKLALLWMLEDQGSKINRPKKVNKNKDPPQSRSQESPEAHGSKPFDPYC